MTPSEYRAFVAFKNTAGSQHGPAGVVLTVIGALSSEAAGELLPHAFTVAPASGLADEVGGVMFYTVALGDYFDIELEWFRINTPSHLSLGQSICDLVVACGKASNYAKKVVAHGHELDKDKMASLLHNIVYHAQVVCALRGIDFADVIAGNVAKLSARYEGAFTPEESRNRD